FFGADSIRLPNRQIAPSGADPLSRKKLLRTEPVFRYHPGRWSEPGERHSSDSAGLLKQIKLLPDRPQFLPAREGKFPVRRFKFPVRQFRELVVETRGIPVDFGFRIGSTGIKMTKFPVLFPV